MDGILLINKQKGYTSHDVVAIIKKISKEKVGHTGTLDPIATGVLPLLIGKGTKISKYLINHDKIYEATLKLGAKTDTADKEGKIIQEKEIPLISKEEIQKVLENMIGKQKQIPPMYSAIKVNGKKLYEYARKGQTIEVTPRDIEIYNIKLIKFDKYSITFEVACSKGTYIRTICENIAQKLKTVGYMEELKRTKVGEYKIQNTITIDNITKEKIKEKLITIEDIFKEKEEINLSEKELELFLNGVNINKEYKDDLYRIYNNNLFVGLGIIKQNKLKRDVVCL